MENSHNNLHKKEVLKRLKSVRGHLDHVISMVEADSYCIDILQQSSAVENALKKTDELILDSHLQTCVLSHSHKDKDQLKREIIEVFKRR